MTQQIQIGARLSPATTGTSIGYRVLSLDGTTYIAFTTSGVAEITSTPGAWYVPALVTVPDAGCIVQWGLSGSYVLSEIYGPELAKKSDVDALNVIPAASAGSATVAGSLSIIKASTFEGTITGVVAPSGWTKAYLTVKVEGQVTSADATSVMQLMVTNPGNAGTDGLKIINGASATLAGGSIAIVAVDNEVDITLTDDTTALLTTGNYVYDIKFFYSTSKSGYIYTGTVTVSATATQTYNTA